MLFSRSSLCKWSTKTSLDIFCIKNADFSVKENIPKNFGTINEQGALVA
jgi:hypothetical protein